MLFHTSQWCCSLDFSNYPLCIPLLPITIFILLIISIFMSSAIQSILSGMSELGPGFYVHGHSMILWTRILITQNQTNTTIKSRKDRCFLILASLHLQENVTAYWQKFIHFKHEGYYLLLYRHIDFILFTTFIFQIIKKKSFLSIANGHDLHQCFFFLKPLWNGNEKIKYTFVFDY